VGLFRIFLFIENNLMYKVLNGAYLFVILKAMKEKECNNKKYKVIGSLMLLVTGFGASSIYRGFSNIPDGQGYEFFMLVLPFIVILLIIAIIGIYAIYKA